MNPISLAELDERASLQRRVDHKYLVPHTTFSSLLAKLDDSYEALEIDGEREFRYESVYFDTGDLLCFRQHVADERPRFKTRTRLYEQTGAGVFEIKVKTMDGTMDKRHLDDHRELDDEARAFVDEVLAETGCEPVADRLEPSLTTRFTRQTFAAVEGPERVTCDRWVELRRPQGAVAFLDPDHLLIESKSEGGRGEWDDALAGEGIEPVSFSKYRVGIELPAWVRPLFSVYAKT